MRWVLALLLVCVTTTSFAQRRNVRRIVREAVGEFDRGNYQEARALFLEAYELEPSARLMRGAGMASFEARDYMAAHRQLRQALLEEANPLNDRQRREVEGLLGRTQSFLGRFRIELDPPSAELRVDLRPPEPEEDGSLLLDIGDHNLSATAEGHLPLDRTLTVAGGEVETLRLTLEPEAAPVLPPPERSIDGLGWMLIAGGGAMIAGAVGTLIWWVDRMNEVSSCEDARSDPARRCLNLGTLESQRRGAASVTMILGLTGVLALSMGILRWTWSDDRPIEGETACGTNGRGGACSVTLSF